MTQLRQTLSTDTHPITPALLEGIVKRSTVKALLLDVS